MENPFDEIRKAVNAAKQTRQAIDSQADTMADLLIDSLRSVSGYRLQKLKTALRSFNAHTKTWNT